MLRCVSMNTKTKVMLVILAVLTSSYLTPKALAECPDLTGKYTTQDQQWLLVQSRTLTVTQSKTDGITSYVFTYQEENELPEAVIFKSDSQLVKVSDVFSLLATCSDKALLVQEYNTQGSVITDSDVNLFELIGQNLLQTTMTKSTAEKQIWAKVE